MRQLSLRQGVIIFLVVFVLPGVLLQPFRTEIVHLSLLPEPTLWQSFGMSLGAILIAIVAGYTWNLRERCNMLEEALEREQYRRERERIPTDGGDTQSHELRDSDY